MSKELKFRAVGPSFSIYWEGGGEVPKALKGLYTSRGQAQAAIDKWEVTKPKPRQNRKLSNGEKQN
jgi:hypothetical protein